MTNFDGNNPCFVTGIDRTAFVLLQIVCIFALVLLQINHRIATNQLICCGLVQEMKYVDYSKSCRTAFQNSIIAEPRLLRGAIIFAFYNRSGINERNKGISQQPTRLVVRLAPGWDTKIQ